MLKNIRVLLFVMLLAPALQAQVDDRSLSEMGVVSGTEYEIGGIRITGSNNLDPQVISLITGLKVGQKITLPGEKTTEAIQNLWKQKLFDDIGIFVTEKKGNLVFLEIRLKELPKLSKYGIRGLNKSRRDNLREELELSRGTIVTENLLTTTRNKAKAFYKADGYLNAQIDIQQKPDTTENNAVILEIDVDRGEKVKVKDIVFVNNDNLSDKTLRKSMEETHRKRIWNIFKSSKFIREKYEEDLDKVVEEYNKNGFRDARIIDDTVKQVSDDRVVIEIEVKEEHKYYFGDITWLGNTKYSNEILSSQLKIEKGDVYDASYLQERLTLDPQGNDVSSLYLNNGYLFFNVNPVEVRVHNDTIDMEMRIREGRQATIDKVTIKGNDRTNDHVILRELRTKPGQLFRKSDVQRSMRELQQLGFFEPSKLNVNPQPDAETGTVDIEYSVVERSTSQLELQGGWGAGRIVGTLGLNFNNFSAKNFFKKGAWQPLLAGDGQTINLRAQSNGLFFQSYSISFTEPWLGGKKPNSFTVSLYHNRQNLNQLPADDPNVQSLNITGVTVSLGQRLKWPDDYFTLRNSIEFQGYNLNNYALAGIQFAEGEVTNVNWKITLGRNSVDYPIYPRKGSLFNITYETTLPYSLLGIQQRSGYSDLEPQEQFSLLEYYKVKTDAKWYTEILPKTVIKAAGEFGFLGAYNEEIGIPPFERFFVGGDGLQNFVLDGREIIGLRGYPNNSIVPSPNTGGAIYNKFTFEMRYLITENPSAQIFALSFLEAGNNYPNFRNYEPFNLKRSAGFGVRIFMPMFGLLGVDIGHGFDNVPGTTQKSGWNTHFTIGQQF